jgi:hypothetical protein
MKSAKNPVSNDHKEENLLSKITSGLLRDEFYQLEKAIERLTNGRKNNKWDEFFNKNNYEEDENFASSLTKLELRDKQATAIRKFIEYRGVLVQHYNDDEYHHTRRNLYSDISKNKNDLLKMQENQLLSLLETNKTTSFDQYIESLDDSIAMVKALTQLSKTSNRTGNIG